MQGEEEALHHNENNNSCNKQYLWMWFWLRPARDTKTIQIHKRHVATGEKREDSSMHFTNSIVNILKATAPAITTKTAHTR